MCRAAQTIASETDSYGYRHGAVILPGDVRTNRQSTKRDAGDDDPDHYSERSTGTSDNGGVHINSGIANIDSPEYKAMIPVGIHSIKGKDELLLSVRGKSDGTGRFFRLRKAS